MIEEIFTFTSDSRLYWPYLLSSFALALLFIKRVNLFSKKYWLNKSLFTDLKIFFFNRFLKIAFIIPFESLVIFKFTKFFLKTTGSEAIFNPVWSEPIKLLVFSLSFFILDDLLRFIQHVCMHKIPFLWTFHKVHHSAHTLNPLTLYRIHFVELILASIRRSLGAIILSCGFLFFVGQFMSFYEILGAHAFYFVFSFIGGNLRHSHIPLSFGFFEHIFISPAQHQIHHSRSKNDYNLNYGSCFSLWDKIHGSFKRGSVSQKIKFGLIYSERKHLGKDWTELTTGPFREIFSSFKISFYEFLNKEEC